MRASHAPTVRQRATGPPDPAPAESQSPLVLGRYRLLRRLGAGGFGTVFHAHDERLDREVAVKIVARERIVGGRFEREARAAARLAHPGIVTLYEAGADDEGAYLVSELVRGPTLDALLSAGRLSDRDIVAIGISLCDAIGHAHAHGVVHRDVKPSNILIPERPAAAGHPAKLTDFGVARVVGGDTLTRTGDILGTAAYMAPEQAEGLDAAAPADLYSVALVLYEALTGVNPVRASTAAQHARRLGAHLPPLRRQRRDLPRELGCGIDLALRPRPRERGTIEELRGSLELALGALSDEPGVVTGAFRPLRREDRAPEPFERGPSTAGVPVAFAAHNDEASTVPRPAWPERGVAALAGAVTTAWLLAQVLSPAPLAPAAAGLIAAAALLVLPRIGWLALTGALVITAIASGHSGAALLIGPAALIPALLLFTAGATWPLGAGAPALGAIGLAGAWPALAARASSPWRRGALGAIGWVWLLVASPLVGHGLYLRLIPGTPAAATFGGSPYNTVHHVIGPLVTSGALGPALVWAAAAVVLPYLVAGRSLALDVIRVIVWAAVSLSATGAVLAAAHVPGAVATPPTALVGAVAGAGVALAPTAFASYRGKRNSPSPVS